MKTAIMTDSNSGISATEAKELGIILLPMPVIIDGSVYYEEINISSEEFFEALNSGKNLSTSQPSPGDVIEKWTEILENGFDEIVYIPMSSGLSHSCETAKSLATEFNGKVHVVDNHRISVTLRHSVIRAKDLAKSKISGNMILKILEEETYHSSIYIAVNTLEFLKKGGRVTPAAAAIGAVLNIKPILTIQGEQLDSFAKVRGMVKAREKMFLSIKNDIEKSGCTDEKNITLGIAGAGLNQAEIKSLLSQGKEYFPNYNIFYDELPFSISVHTGQGAIGMGICY